jgi:hypothetical protein
MSLKPIDYLLESLEEYTRAKIDHDDQMNRYSGEDWITFGRSYIVDLHETKDKLEQDLTNYIRTLIREELNYYNRMPTRMT